MCWINIFENIFLVESKLAYLHLKLFSNLSHVADFALFLFVLECLMKSWIGLLNLLEFYDLLLFLEQNKKIEIIH